MKKKKIIMSCISLIVALLVLVGCDEKKLTKSYSFKVENGDIIELEMDISGGDYDFKTNETIDFMIDDEVVSNGLISKDYVYDMYSEELEDNENVKIIEQSSRDDIDYIFYEFDGEAGKEYNYIIRIKKSNTCFVLGNPTSRKTAKDIFNRLTFSVIE